MGRKTFESIGSKPLPNRRNIVISRNLKLENSEVIVCDSIESALLKCEHEDVVFVIGGAEIYRQTLAIADILYLTRVKTKPEGDSYFPDFEKDKWSLECIENHKADDKNEFDYSFLNYVRK
jgi:dihydrofolate reductase